MVAPPAALRCWDAGFVMDLLDRVVGLRCSLWEAVGVVVLKPAVLWFLGLYPTVLSSLATLPQDRPGKWDFRPVRIPIFLV